MLTIEKETEGLSYRTIAAFFIKYFYEWCLKDFCSCFPGKIELNEIKVSKLKFVTCFFYLIVFS